MSGLTRGEGGEEFAYSVSLNPFSFNQTVDGKLTAQSYNQLYFEDRQAGQGSQGTDTCFDGLAQRALTRSGMNIYLQNPSLVKQAIAMSFWLPGEDQTLYGIPEREDTLALKVTTGTDPYEIFATDRLHSPGSPGPLYGSIPYVMGLSAESAVGLLWVNSAKTTIDIDRVNAGLQVTYASEANTFELFMFASNGGMNTTRVKNVGRDLSTISGFAPLPLIHTLGYHFCKWYYVSADMMMQRNTNFTNYGFPVDVLWSDIEWAQQNDDS